MERILSVIYAAFIFFVIQLFFGLNALGISNVNLSDRLIPQPKHIEFTGKDWYKICDDSKIRIKTANEITSGDKSEIEDIFEQYWDIEPDIEFLIDEALGNMGSGAYKLSVDSDVLDIFSKDSEGIFQGLKTLRQLSEPMRGTLKTDAHILPQCKIDDFPGMDFRGIHLVIMPETKAFEIEKKVRLAAYYKFNYVILEFWGCYPSEVRPGFNFENPYMTRKDIKNLVETAKKLRIMLIPQMTVFGHASGSMFRSGKHSALDLNPEFAPLFEPTGWTWCLSNPHTREVLTDMALEMWELFGRPKFFHIGCDEAYDFATCSVCSQMDQKELLKNHIVYFRDLFSQNGVRIMMWHDMLLEKGEWKGLTASAKPEQGLKNLYKELPKDIIICCWEYGYIPSDQSNPVFPSGKFFADAGFTTLMCSWTSPKNTYLMGKFVEQASLYGMLGTMWYNTYGEAFQKIYMQTAAASWGGEPPQLEEGHKSFLRRLNFDRHLRQVSIDMGIDKMEESGRTENQEIPRFLY